MSISSTGISALGIRIIKFVHICRIFLLIVYFIINILVSAALILLVVLAPTRFVFPKIFSQKKAAPTIKWAAPTKIRAAPSKQRGFRLRNNCWPDSALREKKHSV